MVQRPPKKKGKAVAAAPRKNKPQKAKPGGNKDKLQRILRDPKKAVGVTKIEASLAAVAQPVHSNLQLVNTQNKK
ncbi:hypothetical protein ETH_00028040 [Eimeria tenella]|uniref:Uncharacterized protein n=1 Tax=Eimeria tenella TaxID=5802 RepID=U6L503_EIMTE|nr:hypothetical protein ETH_00028040 [Eimeria tenella]CDJ45246.1 hypothetical protein ETH_00028040 [Eimeria tenella]|eukprot:XP_013235993.1 hypothetical protein ETH_00028040 [Eimeria tenella]